MQKELEALKQQNILMVQANKDEMDNRSTLNVNGHSRIRRRRRSSSSLGRTCFTCNIPVDASKSGDDSDTAIIPDFPTKCETTSMNGHIKDKTNCKHHTMMKRRLLFTHSNSSPNLLNKSSRVLKGSEENSTHNIKRPSIIKDIPDINVLDMSETEKTDNESSTLNVLENILALESDTGLSEMSDNSDKSNDSSDGEISL